MGVRSERTRVGCPGGEREEGPRRGKGVDGADGGWRGVVEEAEGEGAEEEAVAEGHEATEAGERVQRTPA